MRRLKGNLSPEFKTLAFFPSVQESITAEVGAY
jgi:hypothetical protein